MLTRTAHDELRNRHFWLTRSFPRPFRRMFGVVRKENLSVEESSKAIEITPIRLVCRAGIQFNEDRRSWIHWLDSRPSPVVVLLRWRKSPDDYIDGLNHSCLRCPGCCPGIRFLLWSVRRGEDACPLADRCSAANSDQVRQSVNLLHGGSTSQDSSNASRTLALFCAPFRSGKNFLLDGPPSLRMHSAQFIENLFR